MVAAMDATNGPKTTPELLRGLGQVRLRSALRISVGRALADRDSLYQSLLWGVGTGVFNSLTAPPFLRPSIFLGCMIIAFEISYISAVPWRWRLVPRRAPVWARLAANGLVAFVVGYVAFFTALTGSTALILGPQSITRETLTVFLLVSIGGFIFSLIGYYIATSEDTVRRENRLRREARRHEEHARLARLAALRAQINPHFFFNALNTIAALIPTRPADAERAVELMATALRPVLTREQSMVATLHDELLVARAYAEIEQLRFGQRVVVEFVIGADTETRALPSLALQPLLENAFRHGAAHTTEPFRINVASRLEDHLLVVEIHSAPQARFGVLAQEATAPVAMDVNHALGNIQARLRALFLPGSGLTVLTSADGLSAGVTLRCAAPRQKEPQP